MDSDQGKNLTPFFGDLVQNEKKNLRLCAIKRVLQVPVDIELVNPNGLEKVTLLAFIILLIWWFGGSKQSRLIWLRTSQAGCSDFP